MRKGFNGYLIGSNPPSDDYELLGAFLIAVVLCKL